MRRSPGADGFLVEHYEVYVDILSPFLTEVFQGAFPYDFLPEGFNEAIV